jgi:hypothetical protein
MPTKTAISKKAFEEVRKTFCTEIDKIANTEEGPTSALVKNAFAKAMKCHFVLVDEHGAVVKDEPPKETWNQQEPGIDY